MHILPFFEILSFGGKTNHTSPTRDRGLPGGCDGTIKTA
jgi:hypothetical protein